MTTKSACDRTLSIALPDEHATERLGRALAPLLGAGDTVFLSGPLGAGKSALARAVIRSRPGSAIIEVPSPSYTLVNVYDSCETEIWHADLYRLSDPEEMAELGLTDAWDDALVLVEWPEKIGNDRPVRRLEITLHPAPDGGRDATIRAHGPGWEAVIERIGGFS